MRLGLLAEAEHRAAEATTSARRVQILEQARREAAALQVNTATGEFSIDQAVLEYPEGETGGQLGESAIFAGYRRVIENDRYDALIGYDPPEAEIGARGRTSSPTASRNARGRYEVYVVIDDESSDFLRQMESSEIGHSSGNPSDFRRAGDFEEAEDVTHEIKGHVDRLISGLPWEHGGSADSDRGVRRFHETGEWVEPNDVDEETRYYDRAISRPEHQRQTPQVEREAIEAQRE